MNLQVLISGLNPVQVTSHVQLKMSILSKDGYNIPYRSPINRTKNEVPLPFILQFTSALPDGSKVYAMIDGKNKRECPAIENGFYRYQLNFLTSDFSKTGRKPLDVWFEVPGTTIKEYIQEKHEFIVTTIESQ